MELGLQFDSSFCYEATGGITAAHEEALETAIPEYCPDIARIVDTAGQLTIREKLLSESRCTVSGSVKVTVLYTSEEVEGLRSLTMSVPFSCVVEDRALEKCGTVSIRGRVLLTEGRTVTSRKLYLKVMPEITVTGYRPVKRQFSCDAQEEPTVRRRCRQLPLSLLSAVTEKGFSFTDEVMLDGSAAAEDLLLYRLCPSVLSAQRLGNKLMVKGEMALYAIYRDGAQGLRQYSGSLPFSQILDAAELPEEADYVLTPTVGEGDVRILRTDTGCGFGVTAHVDVLVRAYQQRTVTYLEDLYSTRFDTTLERQEAVIPTAAPPRALSQEAQLRLEFEGAQPFISVTGIDCSPVELTPGDGITTLRTTLHVRLLYLDESGAPVSTERTAEVCGEVSEIGGPVTVDCCPATLQFSGGACQVRLPVTFTLGCAGEQRFSSITAATFAPAESKNAPSLILCRMSSGESLWDIAKRFHTDEEAIRVANQLENEEDAAQYMLLIPKIR